MAGEADPVNVRDPSENESLDSVRSISTLFSSSRQSNVRGPSFSSLEDELISCDADLTNDN